MKLNVNEDQKLLANDTITAACPTNILPNYTNVTNNKNELSKTVSIRFNHLQVCSSGPTFVFAVLFKTSFIHFLLSDYFSTTVIEFC